MNFRGAMIFIAVVYVLGAPVQVVAQDWIVKFRPGDTLWDLCIKYSNKRGCWIELGKHNNISDDRAIPPGSEIRFPRAWLTTLPLVGKVESLRGDVLYDERSSGALVPLVAGQSLALGSRIVTREGTAQITLGNSSSMLIRPRSELQLDSMSTGSGPAQSAELSLEAGDVEVEVKPNPESRFQIKTPSAIAAVRGTQYRVSSRAGEGASTRSEVLAGAVQVQGVGVTLVPAGFGLIARQGQALGKPRELLPPPAFQQKRADAPLPVELQWRADPGAVSWHLDLLQGEEGGEVIATYALSKPEITLTGLDEACYRLVLRAIDEAGFNGLESQLPVCVVAELPAPADISIDSLDQAPSRYRVAWSPVTGASQYRLEVATDAGFGTVISSQVVTQPRAEVTISDRDRFSARVTAIDEHANESVASRTADHIQPDYTIPAVMTALFLLIALL